MSVSEILADKRHPTNAEQYWPPPQGEWTYDDYARLPDNNMRYEVIRGDLYMTPAPLPKHQRVIVRLSGYLWDYLKAQPDGEVYISPIDVMLSNLATPVQPDLLFIAEENLDIVTEKFIEGVPDLIVEVLLPGNPGYDRQTKFQIYAQAGVKEYWMIDAEAGSIEIYVLRGQAYALLGNYGPDDHTQSEILRGFSVNVADVCLS